MRDIEELVRFSKEAFLALNWAREVASSCLLQAKQGLKEEACGFVKFAEACWKLRFQTLHEFEVPEVLKELPLWRFLVPLEYSWRQFCIDMLEVSSRKANLASDVWAVFVLGWGLSKEELERIGKSKLLLALPYARHLLETSSQDKDFEALVGLDGSMPSSWHEIHEYLKGLREPVRYLLVDWVQASHGRLLLAEDGFGKRLIGEVHLRLEELRELPLAEWVRERMRKI
jgi:hypothetical protein